MKLHLSRRNKNIGAVLSIAVIFMCAVVYANQQVGHRFNQAASGVLSDRRIGVLGESYEAKEYKLTFTQIQGYPVDELTGLKRITVSMTITNTANAILQIAPGLQMSVTDSSGTLHMATARYLADGQIIGGPIQAGSAMNIDADFDLPSEEVPVKFTYQTDLSMEPTVIKL